VLASSVLLRELPGTFLDCGKPLPLWRFYSLQKNNTKAAIPRRTPQIVC
jgi:hypothetical protein